MKQRLKGLLALVLSLTMVLGLMTCAWGANYTVSTSQLDYNGTVYEPLQEGQLLFAGDVIMEGEPTGSGGYFVIWNGTEYESLGSSNEVFYDDSSSQKNSLDPALYCEGSYTIPSGKYIFREFGEAFLNHNNQGTDPLYYYDTSAWANYPVSYIHLVPVYTVTYDLQYHGTMTTATQTDIPAGETVDEPADPTEAGWTFGGWYEEAACSNAYDFTSAVHSSFTLYAKWTENSLPAQYTVKFDANGGSGTMNDATDVSGDYTLPANGFTAPAGKEFIGWSVDPAGAERMRPGEQMQITKDTTLYAIWKSTGGNGGQGPSIPTPEPEVTPPKTFDNGVALHIGMTILAASGSAWLAKKKD